MILFIVYAGNKIKYSVNLITDWKEKKCTGNIKNCLLLALLFSYVAINVGIYLKGRKISLLVHDLLGF